MPYQKKREREKGTPWEGNEDCNGEARQHLYDKIWCLHVCHPCWTVIFLKAEIMPYSFLYIQSISQCPVLPSTW